VTVRSRGALVYLLLTCACTTVSTELRTTQSLYKDARYEEAQRWLAELELEKADMSPSELARFHYLRGMTAFRLGQAEDALHYLVLAQVLDQNDESRLPPSWRAVMERTLAQVMPTSASPHARTPSSL
jgi:hypothetical protein